ncbi:hypothetical protein O7618_13575 [Micromonospora sp. WMMD980]|nr:hypothetical protein [Micromonospora sp. WMMD980]MDG4801573.1 hypothetical protein [Micromonospora sp. WMMD980]
MEPGGGRAPSGDRDDAPVATPPTPRGRHGAETPEVHPGGAGPAGRPTTAGRRALSDDSGVGRRARPDDDMSGVRPVSGGGRRTRPDDVPTAGGHRSAPGGVDAAGRTAPGTGRRAAPEPDRPAAVPRSGNAPGLPGAAAPVSGGPVDAAGPPPSRRESGRGRRAASGDGDPGADPARTRRRAADDAGEPRPQRPERPADWLRQAGRTPHTDPAMPAARRPAGPPVDEPAARPAGHGPAGRAGAAVPPVRPDQPEPGNRAEPPGVAVPPARSAQSGPPRGAVRPGGAPAGVDRAGGGPVRRGGPPDGDRTGAGPARGGVPSAGPGTSGPHGDPERSGGIPVGGGRPADDPTPSGGRPPGVGRGAPGPASAPVPRGASAGPVPHGDGAGPVPRGASSGPVAARAAGVARPAVPKEQTSGRGVTTTPDPARPAATGAGARAAAVVPPAGEPAGARPGAGDGAAPRPAGPDSGDAGSESGGPGGARSDLRRQLRERRRLRMAVLALVSLVLLGAVPLYFGMRTLSRDPVFDTLDALDVPSWAATKTVDNVSGSRWCLQDCRLRERAVESEQGWKQTVTVYEQALAKDGWRRWKVDRCPEEKVEGSYTCWRRDELTLDLWVRDPTCTPPPVDGEPAPSAPPATAAGECAGSLVSVKVRNAIDDERTGPTPTTDPSLTGEDPYPTLTDDPLGEPTTSPS